MGEHLLDINGTRLFVDVRGRDDAPALLYIHGGPGMGCWDFMRVQGDRLAEHFRVIGVDHRGVLRSDPVPDDAPITIAELLADFEAIRRELGVQRWSLLGHSAGGALAGHYAHRHPESVDTVVFDCPALDFDAIDRNRLPLAAKVYDELGRPDLARRCRELAVAPDRVTPETGFISVYRDLGERMTEFSWATPEAAQRFQEARDRSGLSEEQWARGDSHIKLAGELFAKPIVALLPELSAPSAMICGAADLITPPALVTAYREATGGRVVTLDASAHFPQLEEPEAYTAAVVELLTVGRD